MFKPDYRNVVDCAYNREPKRVPLYEHNISPNIMEKIIKRPFVHLLNGTDADFEEYMEQYCRFFEQMGYDTVTFEGCITAVLPNGGALAHPRPGYTDCREKFENYPFDSVKGIYVAYFKRYFNALRRHMPEGMKAIGGVGNGVFEVVQDLAGYENLAVMSFDDPELFAALFVKVGDMMAEIWEWVLREYADVFCVCRFGDDLGYRSNTLLSHDAIRAHILPQYRRIVEMVHRAGRPFLLHSCGCIFDVMDDIIDIAKIDAKHSNEDQIADFRRRHLRQPRPSR